MDDGKRRRIAVVIGGMWRDKVNGNTYCNAKVIDASQGCVMGYIGYRYGYDGHYLSAAKRWLEENGHGDMEAFDGGCYPVKKRALRADRF